MRVVLQRVKEASCTVSNELISSIKQGLMLLIGFEENDDQSVLDLLVKKVLNLRIFSDSFGKMNLDIKSVNGEILAISQFTLYADSKKGNRPSFVNAMSYDKASKLYDEYTSRLAGSGIIVKKGIFGADMQIALINDGPVTIILDSKELEGK